MKTAARVPRWIRLALVGCALSLLAATTVPVGQGEKPADEYTKSIRPFLAQYCLGCHSTKKKKGELDLERFSSLDLVRKDTRAWQGVAEMLENGEMPPKGKPKPSADERRQLIRWTRGMLDAEAHARGGDPGRVVVRRLTNAEFNNTIRDLTGVDLQPARDFPVDGAAGEGFTNAGDALVLSPTLLNKYLNAAKEMAAHVVLVPDGFRFSAATTRRDWTNEILTELRTFFKQFTPDGKLPLQPYLAVLLRSRDDLTAGKVTLENVAAREKLSLKYLRLLWQTLNGEKASFPLDRLRARFRAAKPADTGAILAEINAWQGQLWRFVPIGSYRDDNLIRQLPNDPAPVETLTLKLPIKPAPGQSEVVLYLTARQFPAAKETSHVVWRRPRFEAAGKPALLLKDYPKFGEQFEFDYRTLFADTPKYLTAALESAQDRKLTADALAQKHGIDADLLKRWIDVLAIEENASSKTIAAVPLELLPRKLAADRGNPALNGWRHPTSDLPIVLSNSSNKVEHIPGKASPHRVVVHPMPDQFVAAAWNSPIEATVRVSGKITHVHPACGNGVAWWIEHRRGDRASLVAEGVLDVGKEAVVPAREMKVSRGDLLVLVVDARDGNHVCDLTEINFTISETAKDGKSWDLAKDVADNILDGNPHADKHGNRDVWRFVKGPSRPAGKGGVTIPSGSILAQWRSADPKQRADFAEQTRKLLTGNRPAQGNSPDRLLYDNLMSPDSPLFRGIDLARLAKKPRPESSPRFGLEASRFGRHPSGKADDADSLIVPASSVVEVRLPAALFRERTFVVEGALDAAAVDAPVQFQVLTSPPAADVSWDGKSPLVAPANSIALKQLREGFAEFRRVFPQFICYPRIVPDDEVVCLKLYHREDEPLTRLFLNDEQTRHLNRLWQQHRFITQFPVTEHKNLPLFIGFVTQDQPKSLVVFFEGKREPFRKRAQEFEKDWENAAPRQLESLTEFASRAYRRPLTGKEKTELTQLYATLRKKGMVHEEAFRTVLTRVLISPSFLFRLEQPPAAKDAQPLSDWELATRLSYFLWASTPDAELRQMAAEGKLRDPKVLAEQTARMLKDPKVRGLASEFATQWLHVRDIRQNREKNEKLFPTYDDKLREAFSEESILFFQDLFQNARPIDDILDADHTFLNETLARHYGIPGVAGPQWRRVDGVKKYGRGGVLTLGSVLTKQSGASRTSPVLRGNWLVETLLGEKLPRPPADVPRLPEVESATDATVRQLVEKHASIPQCAVCHVRIDPFGFALERYDPIGRARDRDLAGRPIDAKVRLKDGTEFEGLAGLRDYLVKQRQNDFQRQFCRKLLGYALGRSVAPSDQPLLDEMLAGLKKNEFRLSSPIQTIVGSKQFRYHRGLDEKD